MGSVCTKIDLKRTTRRTRLRNHKISNNKIESHCKFSLWPLHACFLIFMHTCVVCAQLVQHLFAFERSICALRTRTWTESGGGSQVALHAKCFITSHCCPSIQTEREVYAMCQLVVHCPEAEIHRKIIQHGADIDINGKLRALHSGASKPTETSPIILNYSG